VSARLVIAADYVLSRDSAVGWTEVARLPGGAGALLPAGRVSISDAHMEAAIERAEDWLMPHAAALQGEVLEVLDESGRLAAGLRAGYAAGATEWDTDEWEALFLRVVDRVLGPRAALQPEEPAFIADVLLLRELAHHGRLQKLQILPQPA